jgi:hypothetical protein
MSVETRHLPRHLKDRDIFIDDICRGRMVRLIDDDNCCRDLRAGVSSGFGGYNDVGIAAYWMDY